MRLSSSGKSGSDNALTAEFEFWKDNFLSSACLATVFAVVTGVLILLWPLNLGNHEVRTFVHQLWPFFVECGFWLGFLVGLLWAASRRIGCALAGTVPWIRTDASRNISIARVFGQTGCALAFGSCLLWVAITFVHRLDTTDYALTNTLVQLVYTSFASAGVFALLAVVFAFIARSR